MSEIQPFLSFCIFSFNQEKYIKEAIEGALKQTFNAMEIIISDDCSTDNTYNIVKETIDEYNGSHKVIINQNTRNKGVVEHLNYVVNNLVNSNIIIVNAGDDISYPERTSIIKSYFDKNPDVYAICSNADMINHMGKKTGRLFKNKDTFDLKPRNFIDAWTKGLQVFGAAAAYKKEVFDRFRPLDSTIRNEDFILPFRASLLGKIGYIADPLIKYREHGKNMSYWVKMKNTTSIKEFKKLQLANLANKLANLQHFKKDIELNNDIKTFNYLNKVNRKIESYCLKIELLNYNFYKRILAIIRHWRGLSKNNFLIFLFPNLYIKWLMKKQ